MDALTIKLSWKLSDSTNDRHARTMVTKDLGPDWVQLLPTLSDHLRQYEFLDALKKALEDLGYTVELI